MARYWDKSKPPIGPWCLNRDSIQAQGLVGWWPFDQAMPRLARNYGGTGDAIAIVAPTMTYWSDTALAAVFNGTSTTMNVANQSVFDRAHTDPLSVCAFVKLNIPGGPAAVHGLFDKSGGLAPGYEVRFQWTTAQTQFEFVKSNNFGSGSYLYLYYNSNLTNGVERHLAFTNSGSTFASCKLYINGSSVTLTSIVNALGGSSSNATTPTIGSEGASRYLPATLRDVRWYNIAISSTVANAMARPDSRFELYYPLRSRKWFAGAAATGWGPLLSGSRNRLVVS